MHISKSSLCIAASGIALALSLSACGDSSSSSTAASTDESSSSIEAGNPDVPAASSSSIAGTPGEQAPSGETPTKGDSFAEDTEAETLALDVSAPVEGCQTEPVAFGSGIKVSCGDEFLGNVMDDDDATPYDPAATYTDFVGIQKVFEGLKPNERVVFLLRHGDREHGTGSESLLTGLGKYQARSVGAKLKSDEAIFFGHSNYERTQQTAQNIAIGRGQSEFNHKTVAELSGGWYTKDSEKEAEYSKVEINGQYVLTMWAYDGTYADAYYDLSERSEELIGILKAKFTDMHRISVAISHDQLILPFLVYLTNKQIDLNYNANKSWLNFIAGVAMIVDGENVRFVPVKGLDSGLLN